MFRGKEGGVRLQGIITKQGARLFEQHRRRLAALYLGKTGHAIEPSDADVIEYLARGVEDTEAYLR